MGAKFLLRMEDIDLERCNKVYEQQILADLEWLGIDWDGDILRQSDRFSSYQSVLNELRDKGLIYPAVWTRREIKEFVANNPDWPKDPDGAPHYPGQERHYSATEQAEIISSGTAFSWRLDMNSTVDEDVTRIAAEQWGDVVLARKDTPTSYHFAVVIDDAMQGITHVVRGLDLEASTSIHRLLQDILGFKEPLYFHHRLILDEKGYKLSKSKRSTAIKTLREDGATPADILKAIDWDEGEVEAILKKL